jgi:hypothetical protein
VAEPIAGIDDYVGRYQPAPNVVATISAVDGGLFAFMPGRGEAELFQESRDHFFMRAALILIEFERDSSGAVTAAVLIERGRRMRAPKIAIP